MRTSVLFSAALLLLAACQPQPAEESAAAPTGPLVENPALGLALVGLPDGLDVAVNEGTSLELSVAEGGTIAFLPGVVKTNINLVRAAQDHEAEMTSRPSGELKQRMEMGGPYGTTYFSRGRYQNEAGVLEEESVLLLIHPWGDRQLTVRYVYPVGDGTEEEVKAVIQERIQNHLFGLFEVLEDLPPPAPAEG